MKLTFTTFLAGLLFASLFLLPANEAQAQDPHYSQFYAAPLQVNPAMTGVFTGRFRLVANYREQWGSVIDNPFRSAAASFDMRHNVGRSGDFIAYGVNVSRDEAGLSKYVRTNGALDLSFMKQLNGSRYRTNDQYLVGGFQLGLGQHQLDFTNLWFSSQFDLGIEDVNYALDDNEVFNATTSAYVDMSAGLLWYALFAENASFYLGGALHHLNSPKVSFLENSPQELYTRWLGQVGGELPFNDNLSLLPAVIVMGQGPSLTSIFGANFRYTNRDWREVAIRAGIWGQGSNQNNGFNFPSVIFTAILEMNRVNIGISYDVNAGQLAEPTNSRGAFELSLIYVHPASRRERVACPKF